MLASEAQVIIDGCLYRGWCVLDSLQQMWGGGTLCTGQDPTLPLVRCEQEQLQRGRPQQQPWYPQV